MAVAPKGFQALLKDVRNQKFKYAKTVTLPFFHSGLVELPPGGQKRVKNSRQNHIVFWVFVGRVKVTMNGAHFFIGRGGMWQVPRGMSDSLMRKVDVLHAAWLTMATR